MMTSAAPVLLALLGATGVGFGLGQGASPALSTCERIAWAGAVGTLALAMTEVSMLGLGVRPHAAPFLVVAALLVLAGVLLARGRAKPTPASCRARNGRSSLLGIMAVAAPICLFTLEAARSPMWYTDHLAIWGLKAKLITSTASLPRRIFADPSTPWSHPEYPLLVPLTLASLASIAGEWHGRALALVYPYWQTMTVLLVYGYLSRTMSRGIATIGGILVGVSAWLYCPANVGTADIPLAFSFALLSTSVLDSLATESVAPTLRLGIASLYAVATKPEGLLFVLLLSAVVAFHRPTLPRRRASGVAMLLAPAAAHSIAMVVLRGYIRGRDTDWGLLSVPRFQELARRIAAVATRVSAHELPAASVSLACIACLLLLTRRSRADVLIAPLVCQVLAYVGVCAFSAFDPAWQVASAVPRISQCLLPPMIVVLLARAGPLLNPDAKECTGVI